MPLPAGFTAQHYNDLPLFEVSASARAKYRAFVEKAWSEEVTARAAFAAQSLSKEDTRYKVERLLAQIFGNIPETSFFGDSAYFYPTNEWDHISSLSTTAGASANSGHIPNALVPFPFTDVGGNLILTNTTGRLTRIYNLSGLPAWPWTVGPALIDTSEVHIEWLVYQGETGDGEATELKDEITYFSAGLRGHAVSASSNPFGVSEDDVYNIPAGLGGKLIRQNIVPDRVDDPRTIEAPTETVLVVTGTGLDPDVAGTYYDTGEVNQGEPIWEHENGLYRAWRASTAYGIASVDYAPPNPLSGGPPWFRRTATLGQEGDYTAQNGAAGTPTATFSSASGSEIIQYALDHGLAIRCQLQLNETGPHLGVLGGRFVFGNKRGIGLEQFSAGGGLNNPVDWINRNGVAIPYWAPIIGAPDVVIVNYTTTGGSAGNYDQFYDRINDIIDIWKQANPNILVILTGNQYSAGLPGSIGSTTDYRTHYPSVFRQIALEREDVMFFNITKWLDNRANHTPRHSVGNLDGRDRGVWDSTETYDIGDVVTVEREETSNSPEARGITQRYICLSDDMTNHRPGIDAGASGTANRWMLYDQVIGNNDIHPSGELERYRCQAYAQLLSGTFPDRTANELLGLTGGGMGGSGTTVAGVSRYRIRL